MMIKISLATLRRIREALPGLEGRVVEGRILRAAFDLVALPGDWKGPINATIHEDLCDFDHGVLVAAVDFMTASTALVWIERGHVRVTAAGYRMGPAGDR